MCAVDHLAVEQRDALVGRFEHSLGFGDLGGRRREHVVGHHDLGRVDADLAAIVEVRPRLRCGGRPRATVCNTEIRGLEQPFRQAVIESATRSTQIVAIIEHGCASGLLTVPESRVAAFAILEMGNNARAWFHPNGLCSAPEVAAVCGTFALRIAGAPRTVAVPGSRASMS